MIENRNIEDIKLPKRHTFFQLKYYLIGTKASNQEKMYFCLLEMDNRTITLKAMQREIDELQDKHALLEIDKENFNEKNVKKKEIRLRQFQRKLDSLKEQISNMIEKRKYIQEEYDFIKSMLIEINKIEPMKDWESEEVQMEYWNNKLQKDLSLRAIAGLPLDIELVQTVLAMPVKMPVREQFEKMIKNNIDRQKMIEKN